jgi:16S rRNA (cytidine1402-2'-O)-methyltransferase
VVATPIGNLDDITLRALRILRESDVIAAEDTRHTRKLLSHFDIHTPLVSLHDYSTSRAVDRLVERMLSGESVAEVSDAGTPGVSDPGYALISKAVEAGISVVPVPGASALLAALTGSGMPMDRFRFVGFPPRQGRQRRSWMQDLATARETLVLFEAPHRLRGTLKDAADVLGPRPACAAKELTKVHEEFIRAPLDRLPGLLPDPVRGEWTLIIGGCDEAAPVEVAASWEDELERRVAGGESIRDAAKAVADSAGLPRKVVYAAALSLRDKITGT